MEVEIIFNRVIGAEKIFEIENSCLIDLRSESEFKSGTISGAINVPILNDKEREEVGYTYVNENISDAKRLAIKYASLRLEEIFNKFSEEFAQGKNLILFCARGGMRSGTVHNFFNSIGIKNYKLDKGYKGYRKFLRDTFPILLDKINFIVIHGKTGIGKTKILKSLKEEGYPVIDLENAANHRASFLGGVNLGAQNSQKQFESIVFHDLMKVIRNADFSNGDRINVFVEGESKRIGKIILPEYLFNAMVNGIHLRVDLPNEIRIENLMEDYFKINNEDFRLGNYEIDNEILKDFENSMKSLEKYASSGEMRKYFDFFRNGNYRELALELIENYYDPKYLNSMKKHKFEFEFQVENLEQFLTEMRKVYSNV